VGSAPGPAEGVYSAPPDHLAALQGKDRGKEGKERREGEGGEGRGRRGGRKGWTPRIDGNDASAGHELNKLQSALNAAARLKFSGKKHDHVTPLMRDLHWLQVQQHIEYKIAVLAYQTKSCHKAAAWYGAMCPPSMTLLAAMDLFA